TGSGQTVGTKHLRRGGVAGRRRAQEVAVEYVEELRAELEGEALLNAEHPAQAHVFRRLPLPSVVVVIRRGGAPLPGRGLAPCGGVEDERLAGVEAMAVRVIRKERLASGVG